MLSAIFIEKSKAYVYVKLGENQWEKREVKTGINDISRIEIIEGLKEGEEVALIVPKSLGGTSKKKKN